MFLLSGNHFNIDAKMAKHVRYIFKMLSSLRMEKAKSD